MKIKKICCISILIMMSSNSIFAITHNQLATQMSFNNPSLVNSRKDIDLAKLDLKDAKATYQPTIELLTSATYMVNPPLGKIVVNPEDYVNGESGTSGSLSSLSALGLEGPITVYQGMEDTYYNFDIKITQPLFTWNKINTSVELYDKVVTIREIQSSSQYKKLLSELEAREAAIYYIKEMKKNLIQQKNMANELIQIISEAKTNDLVLEQDVLEVKIKEKQIEVGLKKLEKEEKTQISKIITITNNKNISIDDIEYQVNEDKISSFLKKNKSELIKKAISTSNDNIQILSILKDVKADETTIANNSIYWKPDLALQVETSYSGSRFPLIEKGYYTKDQSALNLTIAIKSTLWDGGKKINDIKRKEINETKAIEDIENAKNQILESVNENLYTMELDTTNIEFQELNSQIIQKRIDNLTQEYNQGYADKTQVLKAKLEKNASDLEILKQKTERATAYFTLRYLTQELN